MADQSKPGAGLALVRDGGDVAVSDLPIDYLRRLVGRKTLSPDLRAERARTPGRRSKIRQQIDEIVDGLIELKGLRPVALLLGAVLHDHKMQDDRRRQGRAQ
jgi:hypothetical protein